MTKAQPTFVVYIDESGDEGFRFNGGSSEWFVLSGIIVRKANDLETVKIIDGIRRQLGKPDKKILHFRDLKHEQRLPYVQAIATSNLRAVSVLIHKPSIKEPEKFQVRYHLYFYAVRYLFERLSWYCRDHKTRRDIGDGSAEIVFSNRSGMSYDELKNYFQVLRTQTGFMDIRIAWEVIKPEQIASYTAGRRMGLQIADAVASSYYYAVQDSRYGFTEDRYAQILKPIVYQHEGQVIGYGLKFWPRGVDGKLITGGKMNWIK